MWEDHKENDPQQKNEYFHGMVRKKAGTIFITR